MGYGPRQGRGPQRDPGVNPPGRRGDRTVGSPEPSQPSRPPAGFQPRVVLRRPTGEAYPVSHVRTGMGPYGRITPNRRPPQPPAGFEPRVVLRRPEEEAYAVSDVRTGMGPYGRVIPNRRNHERIDGPPYCGNESASGRIRPPTRGFEVHRNAPIDAVAGPDGA